MVMLKRKTINMKISNNHIWYQGRLPQIHLLENSIAVFQLFEKVYFRQSIKIHNIFYPINLYSLYMVKNINILNLKRVYDINKYIKDNNIYAYCDNDGIRTEISVDDVIYYE